MLFKISSAIASGDLDLDLRDCGAQTLPAELLDLPLLAGLDASRNALTNDVFEQLKDFPHLRAVNLTCNLLTSTLPPAIGALPSAMEEICLDDNVIEQLPLDMAALGSLSWLSVRRNTLLDMPGALLASWRQLTHLDLRDNKLKALPEEIGECTSLTELLLTGNQLVDLPEGIGRCSHLEVLLANRNQLAALPAGLIGCSALIQLDVTGNKLTDIPGSILTGMVNLKVLMAGFNKLSSLPTEIACCSALEVLSVASNAIKSLPDEVGSLVNLREIYAGNNAMTALPATVTNWTQLETGNFRCVLPVGADIEVNPQHHIAFPPALAAACRNCKLKALPPGVDQAWMQATLVDVRAWVYSRRTVSSHRALQFEHPLRCRADLAHPRSLPARPAARARRTPASRALRCKKR